MLHNITFPWTPLVGDTLPSLSSSLLFCQASYGLFLSALLDGFVMIVLLSCLFRVCLMVLSRLDCFRVESRRHNAPISSFVRHPICVTLCQYCY